jgi:DNA-binding CsgD family transcriptional regulator
MKDLGHYIERINRVKTPDEAFKIFCEAMNGEGYDRIAYTLCTDHPSLKLPRQHGLATSYPEEWMKYYVENNYMNVDPVIKQLLASRKPFFWDDVTAHPETATDAVQLMNEAAECRVRDGIGISLAGKPGEIVGIGLARSDAQPGRDYEFMARAYLLGVYFHETYRSMLEEQVKVNLSEREREILCWAAEGKTDEDIGTLLNISSPTVRFHWRNIFTKLEANGRVYAITKAIRLQLIVPQMVTYQKR